MRIKKIELFGFKSFADRTEIHLGSGVTCVVGPNGCGKSNISDAIRWVFGERSAKMLRGTKMEDVIFGGTEFRKPLGMAEVSLTLDNEDRALAIDYNEVVLTRRLDRSGQSQYFLNKTPCRLKDLLDLILNTGMGSNSYSMMEQGRVDAVINADPEERRFLIEEAAGISKYKLKKEEALRKLERTEQNLLRIRDIVSEVQRNIQYAERQAKRAERYKVQFEDLKQLEIQKAFLDLGELETQKKETSRKKDEFILTTDQLERELRETARKETGEKKLLDEITEEESRISHQLLEARAALHAFQERSKFNYEFLNEHTKRHIEIQKERELLGVHLDELTREKNAKEKEEAASREEFGRAQETFQSEKHHFEEGEKKFRALKEAGENLKRLQFEIASRLAQIRNEVHRLQSLIERHTADRARRKELKERLSKERSLLETNRLSQQEKVIHVSRETEEHHKERETHRNQITDFQNRLKRINEDLMGRGLELQEAVSRLQLLEELENSAEESQKNLEGLLKTGPLQGKLVRRLRDVLHIQEGYEAAVEAVLGSFAEGLITEDVTTAQGLIREISNTQQGPCGILIRALLTKDRPVSQTLPSHSQIARSLRDVARPETSFSGIFQSLFANVFVVENFKPEQLAEFLPLAGENRLVTREGILLGPDHRIFFRNLRQSPGQSAFTRKPEIQKLRERRRILESQLEHEKGEKAQAEEIFTKLSGELQDLESRGMDSLVKKEAFESLLTNANERIQRLEDEIRILEIETQETNELHSESEKQIASLQTELNEYESKEETLIDQVRLLEEQIAEFQLKREDSMQSLMRQKTLLENYEERFRLARANTQLLSDQAQNTHRRLAKLQEEEAERLVKIRGIQEEEKQLELKIRNQEQVLQEKETALNETKGRKSFYSEKHNELSNLLQQREEEFKGLKDRLHEQELKIMDFSYREKNIIERVEQAYRVRFSELSRAQYLQNEIDLTVVEEKIEGLREKVEAFGPVNLLAVDEYEELKQRFEFLSGQEKDLVDAREALLEAIRKINRTTKTLFVETFERAQALFQEYYQTLFGGGRAELVLHEAEESQEAGIDILVHPPGKKPQHISLLSGGEKALTAVALLFALFRIKPSPLCVLDEVDAPLDEANIERFLTVLRSFLETTQFLIVTHNRKTIAMGDYLYGVTMEESGISKLVSVKVVQKAVEAPAAVAA